MSNKLISVETSTSAHKRGNLLSKKIFIAFTCLFTFMLVTFAYVAVKNANAEGQVKVAEQKKGDSKFGSMFLWGKAFGMLPTIVK